MSAIRFVLADSIAFLKASDWDRVSASSSVFLSRRFLGLLEQNLPANLTPHYELAYQEGQPVAGVVAQSLDIRVADLASLGALEDGQGLWRSLGKATARSISRHKRILLFGSHLPWAGLDEAPQAADHDPELWRDVASSLLRQWHGLLKAVETAAKLPVARVHQRLLVCGNLLSAASPGVGFAEGEDPARLWAVVEEALYRIHRSMKLSIEFDLVVIKDLSDEQKDAAALRRFGFRRFETEPNMILHCKPGWRTFEDYLEDMRSDYRSGIRKTIADLETSGIVLERLAPEQARARAPEIHRLYLQVHERQKLRLVTIHPQWIPALAASFGDDFRTVIARPRQGNKLLGFVNVIRDGASAHGYYIGFDKATAARGTPLYLGLVYAGVGEAIEMGAKQIFLGRTALVPKAQIGAPRLSPCMATSGTATRLSTLPSPPSWPCSPRPPSLPSGIPSKTQDRRDRKQPSNSRILQTPERLLPPSTGSIVWMLSRGGARGVTRS
ncbi:MAG: GNAT family N-acetyltransferase [Acidobacteriaceae bacterium]